MSVKNERVSNGQLVSFSKQFDSFGKPATFKEQIIWAKEHPEEADRRMQAALNGLLDTPMIAQYPNNKFVRCWNIQQTGLCKFGFFCRFVHTETYKNAKTRYDEMMGRKTVYKKVEKALPPMPSVSAPLPSPCQSPIEGSPSRVARASSASKSSASASDPTPSQSPIERLSRLVHASSAPPAPVSYGVVRGPHFGMPPIQIIDDLRHPGAIGTKPNQVARPRNVLCPWEN